MSILVYKVQKEHVLIVFDVATVGSYERRKKVKTLTTSSRPIPLWERYNCHPRINGS